MNDFAVVGKNVLKKDSLDKVLGKTKYAGDMEFENMLYGEVVRSTIASGYIKKIDTSKALNLDGVIKILTYKDIPGKNRIGIILKDEPVLVDDKVRRIGDAIALVAAETKEIARKAAELVEIEYEKIEPVFSFERALEEDSPKIHGTSNILNKKTLVHGDIDKGFEQCDVIVENTYKTSNLSHMFIEPEAGIAKYENGIITICSSTQNPHFDRGEIAATLKIPNNRVRSIQAPTGGGFGGKLDISVQCHLALLTYYTKRPVKMVRSRKESSCVSGKRHAMTMTARTGATKEGKILAHKVIMTGDTGAYASYGPAVTTRAMVHCTGPYIIPNVKVEATFVYTNNPMAGAFRGFGVPQVAVLHEGQIEALAKKLNIDPIKLRLLNSQVVGSETATGQILQDSVGLVECINMAVEKANEVIK